MDWIPAEKIVCVYVHMHVMGELTLMLLPSIYEILDIYTCICDFYAH